MEKLISVIFIFFIATAWGSSARRPKGLAGVVNDLPGFQEPYIIGGEIVQGREFAGQVALLTEGELECGGSIINENYILVAAQCLLYPIDYYTVLSGTNNLTSGGTLHNVTEMHPHEQYDPYNSWFNDVAVMKVDPPFVFDADHITAPVTLPAQDETTPIGSKATTIGWGEGPKSPNDLYKVDLFIWNHTLCNDAYVSFNLTVHPEQICTNTPEGGKGFCYGDGGGPLFVNGVVVGISSWGKPCGLKDYPDVYTRVSAYRDWIDSNVKG